MASFEFGKLFDSNVVDNSAAETIYTVPSTPTNVLLMNCKIRFSNTTAGAVTVQCWAGAGTTDQYEQLNASVPSNDYIDLVIPVLAAGETISAQAGAANSISAHFLRGYLQS